MILLPLAGGLWAETSAPDAAELTKLLQDFLAGAGRNDSRCTIAFGQTT